MSRRMRPLPTRDEWCLEWLAGLSKGVKRGTVSQRQLETTKGTVLVWGVDPAKVEAAIVTMKAPARVGEI